MPNRDSEKLITDGYTTTLLGDELMVCENMKHIRVTSVPSYTEVGMIILCLRGTARDLFMFSFYARGMPFVDIVFLKHDSIINGIIYYERNKTGQRMQVRVIPPLAALIEKYRSSYPYVLPYITSFSDRTSYMQYRYALGNVNRLLKRLGRRLHLPLVLTTYVARHSWATIAKEEGFSIASISEGLGHTSEATTQIYLQSFNSEVIDKINEQVVASIGRHI